MTENKRFIRNIIGEILDIENDKFYHDDYHGKPLDYEDEVVALLNELNDENNHIKQTIREAYETERTSIGKSVLKQLLEAIQ